MRVLSLRRDMSTETPTMPAGPLRGRLVFRSDAYAITHEQSAYWPWMLVGETWQPISAEPHTLLEFCLQRMCSALWPCIAHPEQWFELLDCHGRVYTVTQPARFWRFHVIHRIDAWGKPHADMPQPWELPFIFQALASRLDGKERSEA